MDNRPMNNEPCDCNDFKSEPPFMPKEGDVVAIHMDNYKIMGRPQLRELDNKIITIDRIEYLPQGIYYISKEYPDIKLPMSCIREYYSIFRGAH